jgi:hypothetical protein
MHEEGESQQNARGIGSYEHLSPRRAVVRDSFTTRHAYPNLHTPTQTAYITE